MRKWKLWLAGVIVGTSVLFSAVQPVSAQYTPPSAPETVCALEGVGWIVCPVLRSAAKAADFAFSFIAQSFMGLEIELFDADSGARQAWTVMWNVANVSFVVALLWVVYGHITGRAAGTYNIKRMLPRLVIGAILVQVSFFIAQVMVDVSNIMGASINNILIGVANSIGVSGMPLSDEVGKYDKAVLASVTGAILGKGQVAWVLLAPLTAIVLLSAIICAIMIVILIARKTLVMALILLSPLAFVAYLLPSTEHLFSRWLKVFMQTLLLFPVIAVLLGTGQIVSASIIKAGGDYNVADDAYVPHQESNETSATLRLVAAGAAILPLAGTWWAFKAAMSGADAAALRVRRGSQRSVSHRRDDAAKRERAAQERSNQTMMQKGITRIQQLTSIQDTRGEGAIGSVFGNRRSRKKTTKSPEQQRFDDQVQRRLNEMRSEAESHEPPLSPQLVYSQALQRYNDAQSELAADEELSLHSSENIDLKASEALLLESLARNSGTPESFGKKSEDPGSKTESNEDKPASDHRPTAPTQAPSTPLGEDGVSTSAGAAAAIGVPIIIQTDGSAPVAGAVNGATGINTDRPDKPNDMELQAKARAAKYVSQSQESLLEQEGDPLGKLVAGSGQSSANEPTPTLQKLNELSASAKATESATTPAPAATPTIESMPSTLRAAELSARSTLRKESDQPHGTGLRITHDDDTLPKDNKRA